jgi:hypothetical protein
VLYLRAGDRFVYLDDLDVVSGLAVEKLDPRGVPTSQEWVSHEAMRWLRLRTVDRIEDGVPVEVGYRILRVDESGQLHEVLRPLTRGTGRLRP